MKADRIGKKVARARSLANPALTQEQLANRIKVSRESVSRLEAGRLKKDVPRSRIASIAQATGLPESWFYSSADVPPGITSPSRGEPGAFEVPLAADSQRTLKLSVLVDGDDLKAVPVDDAAMAPYLQPLDVAIIEPNENRKLGWIYAIQHDEKVILRELAFDGTELVYATLDGKTSLPAALTEPIGVVVAIVRDTGKELILRKGAGGPLVPTSEDRR